jgi:hypothetical protein
VRAYQPVDGKDINGIDYLEVVDHEEPVLAERQRRLRVYFVKAPAEPLLTALQSATPANIRITGGERVTGIVADRVELVTDETGILIESPAVESPPLESPPANMSPPLSGHLEVHVNQRGDFSAYTLTLIDSATNKPLIGLDPALSSIDFSFKIECPTPFDCRDETICPATVEPSPEIDYLTKDFTSFRQLVLDRMSLLSPDWLERNPADLGLLLSNC